MSLSNTLVALVVCLAFGVTCFAFSVAPKPLGRRAPQPPASQADAVDAALRAFAALADGALSAELTEALLLDSDDHDDGEIIHPLVVGVPRSPRRALASRLAAWAAARAPPSLPAPPAALAEAPAAAELDALWRSATPAVALSPSSRRRSPQS